MKAREVAEKLNMIILTGDGDQEVTGLYTCDLLSWVISHASSGDMWVTVMNNLNILAVASLADVACIVLPENVEADEKLLERAQEKEITLIATSRSAANVIAEASKWIESER
ncbi:MAG: AraC family transcriptional regulator [Clostridia bacterium]|nr:AraC family transcriptional regulator [Clostridia bacterium]